MMTRFLTLILMAVSSSAFAQPVQGKFDGWCLPANACTGPMPIQDDSFDTCEERCQMTNPVRVRDMDAVLYDIVCDGDGSPNTEERMMFARYRKDDGTVGVVAVGSVGKWELERCGG